MANEHKNRKLSSAYPFKFNKREGKASTHNYSLLKSDSDFEFQTDDGVNFVRNTGANTVTLPSANSNAGRLLTLYQVDAAIMTVTNSDSADIDGSAPDFVDLDAADDWCTLFCTGSEWVVISKNIA